MTSTDSAPTRPGGFAAWFDVIPILFMINAALGLAHHPFWFNEVQNWSVVRDSPTIAALFYNLGYEGHPGLWYLILWGVQCFTLNPLAMKICHWLIAAASIALIGYLSPFRKLDRVLLMAGYFLLFEYVVISRNYGIGMLLAFLYAHLESKYPKKRYRIYLTLGLLANCNAFTFLLSGVLVVSRLLQNRDRQSWGRRLCDEGWGLCIYALLAGLAAWTMYPPADMKYAGVGSAGQTTHDFGALIKVLLLFLYIPSDLSERIGAHSGFLHDLISASVVVVAMGFTLAPFAVLCRNKSLLTIYTAHFFVVLAFCFLLYQFPGARHIGILWICFVVCYWIKYHQDRRASNLASLFFAFGALWGVYATVQAYRSNYSNAQAAASWVREHGLQQAFWISYDDLAGVPLSAFLDIPTYSPDCQCMHKHVVWNNQRRELAPENVGAALRPVIDRVTGRTAYLISSYLKDQKLLREGLSQADIRYDVLQTYSDAKSDNSVLYRLRILK